MQPLPVDLPRRDHAHADPGGAADDGAEQLLPLERSHLLRVVQRRERPDSVMAEALVVEEHPGDDERPGQRAAAGLVGSGHEARTEPAVEREKALAARAWHADELSAGGG